MIKVKNLILIDTNFFISLLNKKDLHHKKAKKILQRIENQEKVVSDGVILESISLAGSLFGGKVTTALYYNN